MIKKFQFIGPCYVDVTGPIFTPPINVFHSNGHLLALWSKDAFEDSEDPFSLTYEYALGKKNILFCEYNYFDAKFCTE